MSTLEEKRQLAIDTELDKLGRSVANIQAACEDGRITPEKAAERIERAESWCEGRIKWLSR